MFNLKFILIKVKKKERENINLFLIIYLNLIFWFLKKLTNYKSFSLPITLSTIRCKKKECKTSQYSGETMKKKKSNGKPSREASSRTDDNKVMNSFFRTGVVALVLPPLPSNEAENQTDPCITPSTCSWPR